MNTYKKREFEVGGSKPVWIPPIRTMLVGGYLDLTKYEERPIQIPAGSMVYMPYAGGEATIVTKDDVEMLPKVNALTQNDIDIDANTVDATVTAVVEGHVYADYIPEVPESVKAQLKGIHFEYLIKKEESEVGE